MRLGLVRISDLQALKTIPVLALCLLLGWVVISRIHETAFEIRVSTVQASSLRRTVSIPSDNFWQTSQFREGSHPGLGPDTSASAAEILVKYGNRSATTVAHEAMEDFRLRCTAPGVVYCQGFDNSSDFKQNINIFANSTYPTVFPKRDASTGRSGSSLRIDIPPKQGANSGKFYTTFPGTGGSDTSFYFQVATRVSPEMISNFANEAARWPTWKNHAFFNGNTSCTGMSVVTGLSSDGVIPIATANCGSNGYFTNGGVPPYLMQQGDYNCPYRGENRRSCFYWPTDTWVTFYYHVHLGPYNVVRTLMTTLRLKLGLLLMAGLTSNG